MTTKNKVVLYLAGAMLSSVVLPLFSNSVNADSFQANKSYSNQHISSNNLSQSDIELADKYVKVKNNQFYITQQGQSLLPNNVLQPVKEQIKKTNQAITKDSLIVNPETKEVAYQSPFVMFASGVRGATRIHSGCYVRGFW